MEQIVIQVKDKEKAKVLRELLTALDFVDSVKTDIVDEVASESEDVGSSSDFFSPVGMWQGRDISLDSIRKKSMAHTSRMILLDTNILIEFYKNPRFLKEKRDMCFKTTYTKRPGAKNVCTNFL